MIQDAVIPIEFGKGLDTKTDPKKVQAGKFLRLENAVFTKPNQIAKRNGYNPLGQGSALVSPTLTHSYNDELLVADQNILYSYSPSTDLFIAKAPFTSNAISRDIIEDAIAPSGYVDSAVYGNYVLYGYSSYSSSSSARSSVYFTVVDNSSGVVLFKSPILSTSSIDIANVPVRCVNLGGVQLAIVYLSSARNTIVLRTVTVLGNGSVSYSAEKVVGASLNVGTFDGAFDIIQTSNGPAGIGAAIAYFTSNAVVVDYITTAGNVMTGGNISDTTLAANFIYLNQSSNGDYWVYWLEHEGIAGAAFIYSILNSSFASVLPKTLIQSLASPYLVSNVTANKTGSTTQTIFWGVYVLTGSSQYTDKTFSATLTSGGIVGTPAIFSQGITPYSKPISVAGQTYALFVYRTADIGLLNYLVSTSPFSQVTFFLVNLDTANLIPYTASRFGADVSGSITTLKEIIGYSPTPQLINGKYIFPCSIEVQSIATSSSFSGTDPFGVCSIYSYVIDFQSTESNKAVDAGHIAIFNGGILQAYDGINFSEFGFNLRPEITSNAVTTPVGGNIAAGTYSYIAIYQWTDAQGNLHQSTPSSPVSVTVAGANSTVTLKATTAYLSRKNSPSVAFFRNTGTGTTIYYQVSDPGTPPSADPTLLPTVTFVDNTATITGNNQAYTYPASLVLENSVTPPSTVLVAHNNRMWFVDAENTNSIWYTKSFSPGTGLSPSALMLEEIDPKYGDISALSEMDEKLVIFKDNGVFVQSGDGVNDTGSGSSLSFPQFVPSDVGCDLQKSVVLTPQGVMFHSPNGIYILARSLNVSYIGAEVEQYNSQVITSANFIKGKSQIRFLCSSGLTLVYDYIFNQWGTFTGHTGTSATIWNSLYTYANGSVILQETPGVYSDNGAAITMLLQTGWLALSSVQNFQRVRRFITLGDFTNGASSSHGVSVAAAYDFSTTFQSAISYLFGGINTSNPPKVFQYRERLPIQKCDSISLLITELTTGDPAEYMDLTNMSFEAGIKKGVNKLGAAYSVG